MGKLIKITLGTKIHRLQLLSVDTTDTKHHKVKLRCDCGAVITAKKHAWLTGHTKSCGCLQRECVARRNTQCRGELGLSCKRYIYRQYKNTADKKDRVFELSFDEFLKITTSLCHYCGAPPRTVYKRLNKYFGEFVYNGIDRVDNNKGYTLDNTVPCCTHCNRMKSSLPVADFIAHLRQILTWQESTQGKPV